MTEEKKLDERKQKIADAIARDMATFMLHITTKFRGHEKFCAEMLTNSLCHYAAIVAKEPKKALRQLARTVLAFDYNGARATHFGYKELRVDPDKLYGGIVLPTKDRIQIVTPQGEATNASDKPRDEI